MVSMALSTALLVIRKRFHSRMPAQSNPVGINGKEDVSATIPIRQRPQSFERTANEDSRRSSPG